MPTGEAGSVAAGGRVESGAAAMAAAAAAEQTIGGAAPATMVASRVAQPDESRY